VVWRVLPILQLGKTSRKVPLPGMLPVRCRASVCGGGCSLIVAVPFLLAISASTAAAAETHGKTGVPPQLLSTSQRVWAGQYT